MVNYPATIKAVSCFSHIPSPVLTNTYTVVANPFAHCSVQVSWNITRGNITLEMQDALIQSIASIIDAFRLQRSRMTSADPRQ